MANRRPLARRSARRDPEGNDRIFAIERRNRGRMRRGTATICRWRWIIEAINFTRPAGRLGSRREHGGDIGFLMVDEARQIAVNFAKQSELLNQTSGRGDSWSRQK